jgi:hypothetical protein
MQSVTCGHRLAAKRMALVLLAVVALVGVMAGSGAAAPGDTTLVSDDGCCAQGDGERTSSAAL